MDSNYFAFHHEVFWWTTNPRTSLCRWFSVGEKVCVDHENEESCSAVSYMRTLFFFFPVENIIARQRIDVHQEKNVVQQFQLTEIQSIVVQVQQLKNKPLLFWFSEIFFQGLQDDGERTGTGIRGQSLHQNLKRPVQSSSTDQLDDRSSTFSRPINRSSFWFWPTESNSCIKQQDMTNSS